MLTLLKLMKQGMMIAVNWEIRKFIEKFHIREDFNIKARLSTLHRNQ
jgi:hypothetical protein